tara:strand:+ start:127 stop:561 length:435 start_codon:yes stop_codon:yes gene_type:complete
MPIVLGVTSQNIRRMIVRPIVEMKMPCSGQYLMAKVVPSAAAAVLIKLLPSKIVDKSFSGCLSIEATNFAPFTPLLAICSNLIFCREIKAVSETEKKADKNRQRIISPKYSTSVPLIDTTPLSHDSIGWREVSKRRIETGGWVE